MRSLLIIITILFFSSKIFTQNTIVYHKEQLKIVSGLHKAQSSLICKSDSTTSIVYSKIVEIPDAFSLRFIFKDYQLGANSKLKIISLSDTNYCQTFNMINLNNWRGKSAILKGNRFEISLIKSSKDECVHFLLHEILIGSVQQSTDETKSICGTDDRIRFEDGRIARMPLSEIDRKSCTAWLANNGAILTAGHCIDDESGGVSEFVDIIEFNIPNSEPDGAQNPALPQDQYPIDLTSLVWDSNGAGSDWGVMRCLPNADGNLPHQIQGVFFRMTKETPTLYENIRITGYGADDGIDNDTEQTAFGSYEGKQIDETDISHLYRVDTRGHNSGSPIIWDDNNTTIGIHTFGSCKDLGYNGGTSFEHAPLENALQNFHGINTIYVDNISLTADEDGTIFSPFNTIQEGIDAVPSGGNLYVTSGTFNNNAGLLINDAITILPPSNGSLIINP